ncbi:Cyclin PHO80-like protein [Aduncisulcus paluster]|uniref:Cyclin PHO80-like protein n=1 Tax=Aduncisulcus paluster TaxID=2918883 RepID=A0ABQ5KX49_9EUKA|nr:Cyclin PHO80-like protein [Aduncisulcus paluster]
MKHMSTEVKKSTIKDTTIDAVSLVITKVITENEKYIKKMGLGSSYKVDKKTIDLFNDTPETRRSLRKYRVGNNRKGVLDMSYSKQINPFVPSQQQLFKMLNNMLYRTRMQCELAIAVLVYIDRLIENSGLVLASHNWMTVIWVCVVAAQKQNDDYTYSLAEYNKLLPGRIGVQPYCRLERTLYSLLDYKLFISPSLYTKYRKHLSTLYSANISAKVVLPVKPLAEYIDVDHCRDHIIPEAFGVYIKSK